MLAVFLLIIIFLLAFSGTPLFIIMALGALVGFHFIADVNIAIIIQEAYRLASAPALIAIPLFTLAGYILAESKAPERLLRFTRAYFGWLPGGIPLAILAATSVFTALTGASGVTIIALGGLLMPIIIKAGYSEKFSIGLITSTGSIGLLFPPSLPIILYGIIAQAPVNELFIAGIIPGLLIITIFFLYSVGISLKVQTIKFEKFNAKEALQATKEGLFEVLLPPFIILGIYTGKFTAAEAATITVVWVIIAETIIYKDIKLKDFPKIAKESMLLVGAIFAILGMAMGFTNFLVDQQIPQKLFEFSKRYIESKLTFLIVLNSFLLICGMLMDIFSAIVVVVPLIVPVALAYGVDPVHLGIIFLTNLEIGYLTPPVGINLFISAFRFGKNIIYLYKVVIPFITLLLICLIIITYVPNLSLKFIRGVIEGKILSEKGEPVSAVIKILELRQEFKTKEDGTFRIFLPLPDLSKPHKYVVFFTSEGYQGNVTEVVVKRGKSAKIFVKVKEEETPESEEEGGR